MIRSIKLKNGISLDYRDIGEGEVILLLHGLGSTKADWDLQYESFSKHYRVIAPDLRGHGNSSKPVSKAAYGVKLWAQDVTLLMEQLHIDSINAVGFSMGGAVAFELAVSHPKLIRSMIIVNTAPDFNNLGWFGKKMVLERTISLKLFGMEPLAKKVATGMFPEEHQKELREQFYSRARKNDVKAYYHSFRTLMKWGIGEKIKDIDVPTLVIASDNDYTPVSLKENYTQKMKNARLEVVKNSRHGVTMDQPEDFNRIILNFIKND